MLCYCPLGAGQSGQWPTMQMALRESSTAIGQWLEPTESNLEIGLGIVEVAGYAKPSLAPTQLLHRPGIGLVSVDQAIRPEHSLLWHLGLHSYANSL